MHGNLRGHSHGKVRTTFAESRQAEARPRCGGRQSALKRRSAYGMRERPERFDLLGVQPVLDAVGDKLGPVVDAQVFGHSIAGYGRFHHRYDVDGPDRPRRMNGQALPGVFVNQSENAKTATIFYLVSHEVPPPNLAWPLHPPKFKPVHGRPSKFFELLCARARGPLGSSVGAFVGGSGLIRIYHGCQGWIDSFYRKYRAAAMGSAFGFYPRSDRTVPAVRAV